MSTKRNQVPILSSPGKRPMRSDATANRERILDAATVAVRREGERVPMATIAAEARVGIGTLYRHYPTRTALLTALTMRSFSLVLEHARAAAESSDAAPLVLAQFFEQTIAARDRFILPFHGGPDIPNEVIFAARSEIRSLLGQVLERGRQENTIRPDVTPLDIIITGAMLAQPLPNVANWDQLARRQAQTFIAGIST
ncbi:MAG TPA: TetR/AcrR family transcriptional regulator [Solirubrobacteraceae bacterium]|jgi:AcrR family transcriptional regulator|nr:TetR/AcrR family transcriptional regulator [Solirubrobacteraceae bacterium]